MTMTIRTTTDPISLRDVQDLERRPRILEGRGGNRLEIYFESEENRRIYLNMELADCKAVKGNSTDDYVA